MKKPQALIGLLAALGTAIGVLVAIVGLPYGRMNYTAFAGLYAPGGTPPGPYYTELLVTAPGGTPGPCVLVAACNIDVASTTEIEVHVIFHNNSGGAKLIGPFNLDVLSSKQAGGMDPRTSTFTPGDNNNNGNPDFNQTGWTPENCGQVPPTADIGYPAPDGNPASSDSGLVCFGGVSPSVPNGGSIDLATVHYADVATAPGFSDLELSNVAIADDGFTELGSCQPAIGADMPCVTAKVTWLIPPTATATNTTQATATNTATNTPTKTNTATNTPTATPTNTPVPGAHMVKVPEGNANNVDLNVPKANLYLCITGPCSGPGEGDLYVVEHASGVTTVPASLGVGAYEFMVEYDNFVIQSLNPCDIMFSAPTTKHGNGAGYLNRGPVDQVNSSAINPDCANDPGPINNGTCTFSLIQENSIRFGCVTNGAAPGPSGSFDVASLDLIPNPNLTNDIFPGNNNGVSTVIKDNGCELADVLGHPVAGAVNGGLLPVCGDLAVTVRILEGDLNLDCKVNVTDQQLIAFRYGSFFGSLLYSKWFDLEPALHDLDIDIKDLQKVFGRDGSTCQNPIPAQLPVDPPVPFP